MFIRARTEQQFNQRRQEIIEATQSLYQTYTFREINFSKISERTHIARSTIYNYYLNKEEIFLDIIEKHLLDINKALEESLVKDKISREQIVEIITDILMNNYQLLILMSLYIEQIEYVCSQEKLDTFKINTKVLWQTLDKIALIQFDLKDKPDRINFVHSFFATLYGIVPICSPITKQQKAMEKAGIYFPVNKKEFISFYINSILSNFYK